MWLISLATLFSFFRHFRVGGWGGSGASALQLPHGDPQESRNSHSGRQEVHGHRECRWTADSLPGRCSETWNDASFQLRSATRSVRGPSQRHGEAPVLSGLRLLLQSGEWKLRANQFQVSGCSLTCSYCHKWNNLHRWNTCMVNGSAFTLKIEEAALISVLWG